MNNRDQTAKKVITYILIFSHFLVGCATTGGQQTTAKAGPKSSSSYEEKVIETISTAPKLDVIIPIFNPGLSENAENYQEEGIWPELRRAEANRFAYKLKQALDNSHEFGAVRVTPDETASGDLYVLGTIEESDGQDVKFKLNVVDISGKEWLDKTFKHEVQESFYKNNRNSGKDPYDPVFKAAVDKIIAALKKRSSSELDNLKYIADLRFGASFNDAAFMEYMDTNGKYIKLVSKPSDSDPLFQRVMAIRVREQLFVDNLQQNYVSFSQNMDTSYLSWQEASFTEKKLRKEAKNEGILKTLGGVALIALAIVAATSKKKKNSNAAINTATIASGVGGALLIFSGFKSREEAKSHQDALNELGESINLELEPRVISFEDESVELTGNIQQQFKQWREFLKRIYEQESTPNTEL
ncbi:MAG: hypothetical protein COB23_00585 [Methylophaga sp.]|nr:MAG: hypothetical protein COB23_00585 [Methylophaga sp.]